MEQAEAAPALQAQEAQELTESPEQAAHPALHPLRPSPEQEHQAATQRRPAVSPKTAELEAVLHPDTLDGTVDPRYQEQAEAQPAVESSTAQNIPAELAEHQALTLQEAEARQAQ